MISIAWKKLNTKSGLTMPEMLITIAVFTLVTVALTSSVNFFYRTNRYTVEQSSAVRNAEKGVSKMVRDIREAAFSDEGSFPLISLGSTSISFYSDTDKDDRVEQLRFFIEDEVLKRGVIKSSGDPLQYAGNPESISNVSLDVRNIERERTR